MVGLLLFIVFHLLIASCLDARPSQDNYDIARNRPIRKHKNEIFVPKRARRYLDSSHVALSSNTLEKSKEKLTYHTSSAHLNEIDNSEGTEPIHFAQRAPLRLSNAVRNQLNWNKVPDAENKVPTVAPKYMLELYNKFSSNRLVHPSSNIVRSFMSTNGDGYGISGKTSNGNKTRIHTMIFNITSISEDEEINFAEVRLYTLVEKDRNRYVGVNRRVSVFQRLPRLQKNYSEHRYLLLVSKHIYGRNSAWETFPVTEAVKSWIHSKMSLQVLQVRIETVFDNDGGGNLDIDTTSQNHNEPLLVVFSNDRRKRKVHARELQQMILHESDNMQQDALESGDGMPEKKMYKRDTKKAMLYRKKSEGHITIHETDNIPKKEQPSNGQNRYTKMEKNYLQPLETKHNSMDNEIKMRVKRSRRKNRRNICRRKPLYVNFADINWHTWIIAPRGYQAYECTGRCYFPLSDHLTPTKHALIQTLLHTNYPKKATRACCVPTKLAPISILYIDEQNVVTFKYKYDDMVVAECGCR